MLADILGPNLLIVFIVMLALPLWAVIDALSRPAVAFHGAGFNKTAWLIVLLVATIVLGIGAVLGAYYLVAVRRKVQAQMGPLSRR
jgi:high-affinity K+ transport system ATPase subunit B